MKIIFFGSDEFAAENLRELLKEKFAVLACVTQPDRPAGRGMKVVASPIKLIAQEQSIPVFQPDNLKDPEFITGLEKLGADLFIVIAYGKILPAVVLSLPKLFCVNVHGSLLPQYRGAAPVNWAIINGDSETGFTLMKMNSQMDAGEIIVQEKMKIGEKENSQQLRERMAKQSAECLARTIKAIEKNKFSLTPQDESKVTLAPKLSKDLGRIDWNWPAIQIHNRVRGLLPWPGAYIEYKGKKVKILETRLTPSTLKQQPGQIQAIDKQLGIVVATAAGPICLLKVQPESGKAMDAYSFAMGQRILSGEILI